jgi:hypothetical protein
MTSNSSGLDCGSERGTVGPVRDLADRHSLRSLGGATGAGRGWPLKSREVIVNTIAATTTRTGVTVHAELDTRSHPNSIKITDQQMEGLEQRALRRHDFHGEWNYTLVPQPPTHPRRIVTSVLLINSHLVNWDALSAMSGTIVLLMAVERIELFAEAC